MAVTKLKRCLMNLCGDENASPLPKKVLTTLVSILLFNSVSMTVVFAFLPQLVKSFGVSEIDTGRYAGLVASSLYFGRILCSILWGYIADSTGNKSTLMICSTGLVLSTLGFGFSTNFYWAFAFRFLQGSFMGIIVVCKSILTKLCDETNITSGMAIMLSTSTTGRILGPALGGFLAFPADLYPETFSKDSLFGKFVVLLPHLIVCVGLSVTVGLAMIFIPGEKKKPKNTERAYLIEDKGSSSFYDNEMNAENNDNDFMSYSVETQCETRSKNKQYFEVVEPITNRSKKSPRKFSKEYFKDSKILRALRIKECVLSGVVYGTFSIAAVGYDELFPVYLATSHDYNGLAFTTKQTGTLLLVVSVFLFPLQLTVFSKVVSKYGPRKIFTISSLAIAFFVPLTPVASALVNLSSASKWSYLIVVLFCTRLWFMVGFLCINILVNNSVDSDLLGIANGLALTLSSIGRAIGPTFLGSLYSWSLSNVNDVEGNHDPLGYPFNQYLPFLLMSIVSVLNAVLVSTFPSSMDKKMSKRVDEDVDDLDKAEQANRIRLSMSLYKHAI